MLVFYVIYLNIRYVPARMRLISWQSEIKFLPLPNYFGVHGGMSYHRHHITILTYYSMKKTATALLGLGLAVTAMAQTPASSCMKGEGCGMTGNGVFNHFDAAFTVGTTGFGFDIATPVTDWVRLRAGGIFRLSKKYTASVGTEIAENIPEAEQTRRFEKLSGLMTSFMGTAPERTVELEGSEKMNHFKFLVDVYPFKNNRHWRVTAGFYYGTGTIISGHNTSLSVNTLAAISSYNMMYDQARQGEFMDMSALGIRIDDEMERQIVDKICSWGETTDAAGNSIYAEYGISMPVGTYAHDIVAGQDIYDSRGNLTHRKGEVIRRAGETVRLVPDKDDMIRTEVKVNKFKPYLGLGYEFAASKDKRSSIGIDAGVLFWGGKPAVDMQMPVGMDKDGGIITQSIDLVRDVNDVPGDLGDHVKTAGNYTVYPEISVRFARRLW